MFVFIFFVSRSACAQRERSTHHLVGYGPRHRCPCATLTPASHKAAEVPSEGKLRTPAVLADADWRAYLSGRSLLPFPRRVSLFRYGAVNVWNLSLSRSDCCCILQPNEQRRAPGKGCASVGKRSAPHANYDSGGNLANASGRARCTAADLRRKLLVGRTGTPWSHFSLSAAPPLSLGCVQPGLTAPPTRH